MTKDLKKELVNFKNWLNENHSGMYMKISKYELDKYCKEQLQLSEVGGSLPTKEEMNIEVSQQLVDWGYNEHSSKKIFEQGFKSSFYWFRNKIKDNCN